MSSVKKTHLIIKRCVFYLRVGDALFEEDRGTKISESEIWVSNPAKHSGAFALVICAIY